MKESTFRVRTRTRRGRLAVGMLVASSLGAAACSGGDSVLRSGEDDAAASSVVATSADTAGTQPEGTGEPTGSDDGAATVPASTDPAPTTTVASLTDFPDCPTDALTAAGPVDIVFWHGMTNELETALISITDEYNASQDRVRVQLENQTSYDSTIDKFINSGQGSRPDLVQLPEYVLQTFAESGTAVPAEACIDSSGLDMSPFLERTTNAYTFEGIQWGMPFNVSNPVLYFNRKMFVDAGLDPDDPPITLEELRSVSQQLVDSGAASYGIVLDSGSNSGGGWFIEQWFGRAGALYADNGNGRLAPATKVLYDGPVGVELLTYVQDLVADGLAVSVGDNAGGQDAFLKMVDPALPGAMTIGTSAALGTVIEVLGSGTFEGLTAADIGVGPMPGPSETPAVQVGGGSLWVVAGKSDETTAAVWDFVTYLTTAQTQSTWAAATGYVPIRGDALDLDPIKSTYANDPRFSVPYDQLLAPVSDLSANGPVLGPQREVRVITARAVAAIINGADVQTALTDAVAQANAQIQTYNSLN